MSVTSLRASKARRAIVDETLPTDRTSVRSILSHGLAALAISALGLGVAGSVALTSAAQSGEVDVRASLSADRYDTTRAEPAPRVMGLSAENRAGLQQDQQQSEEAQAAGEGTLETFGGGEDRTSQNAVRAELDQAIASRQVSEREGELQRLDDAVASSSRQALSDERAATLRSAGEGITAEQERLQAEQERLEAEERRQQEERERRVAEREAGTLTAAAVTEEVVETTEVAVEASQGGGTTPIASGRYSIAARWGAVGSWSRYHTGVDLSAPVGTPIVAAADGVVVSPTGGGWAGIHVVIRHADGSHTLYAHMASAAVSPGTQVSAGTLVGVVGMTGRTFGPHLHFEWYPPGASIGDVYSTADPYTWMLRFGVRLS